MATKMNWDWSHSTFNDPEKPNTAVFVHSTFLTNGLYKIKIFISDTTIQPNTPWKTGKVANCKSHEQAFKSAFKYAKQVLSNV